MRRPANVDDTRTPIMIGSDISPDRVGEMKRTSWKKTEK